MDVTVPVVAVNVAVVAPALTRTEAGTATAVLLSASATEEPPVGAACDNVTVQVELAPETTVAGAHCTDETAICGGVTVMEVVIELPPSDTVTGSLWLEVTVVAVAVKVALLEPAATITEAGMVKAGGSAMAMLAPPLGAAVERVTVQVAAAPETRLVGVH